MRSDFLRVKTRNIDAGRLAITLMHLRLCGLKFFEFEDKNTGRVDHENKHRHHC